LAPSCVLGARVWRYLDARDNQPPATCGVATDLGPNHKQLIHHRHLSHGHPNPVARGSGRFDHLWDLCRHQVLGLLQTQFESRTCWGTEGAVCERARRKERATARCLYVRSPQSPIILISLVHSAWPEENQRESEDQISGR